MGPSPEDLDLTASPPDLADIRFERFFELNPYSAQLVDREGRTLRVNAAHTRLFNSVPPPEYSIFNDPLIKKQGMQDFMDRAKTGEVVHFPEIWYDAREVDPSLAGRRICIRIVIFPLRDARGEIAQYVLMHEDITAQKVAEIELKQSEERLELFFSQSLDGFYFMMLDEPIRWGPEEDHDRLVEYILDHMRMTKVNQAMLDQYGITDEREILGQPLRSFYREDLDFARSMVRNFFDIGHQHLETAERKVDGTPMTIEGDYIAIKTNDGRIAGHFGVQRDITHKKAAEEALRQGQKLESLGVLAGGIAHDFNNLLTAILGNLSLAQMHLTPDSPAQPFLASMEATVMKASELTKQMLAYSGRGRFVVKPHDLNLVVKEMAHLLQVSLSKKIMLRFHLDPGLPPVEADSAQIQQVVMNLVTNAADAIGDADGVISLATSVKSLKDEDLVTFFPARNPEVGRYVVLEVGDNGCGISPEIMPRIFDPFFTTKSTGRGLGLSAMQGILRGHKAGIKICSQVGCGTVFSLFFPTGSAPASPSNPTVPLQDVVFQGCVLLVDDEVEIRESTGQALSALGFEVRTASNGQEAETIFARDADRIRLVILDLTMPKMDGRQTFQALRRIRPDVPVILSSGYNEQESIQQFLGQGLAGFIQKPYRVSDLRQVVAEVLSHPR